MSTGVVCEDDGRISREIRKVGVLLCATLCRAAAYNNAKLTQTSSTYKTTSCDSRSWNEYGMSDILLFRRAGSPVCLGLDWESRLFN